MLCALLLLPALAACGDDGTQDITDDPVSESTDLPETEDTTATEQPDDPTDDVVAVELPGLPIGGSATVVSDTLQCVDVGWSAPPELPDWIAITVTSADLQPRDGFALSQESCGGGTPPCLADGVQLTATQRCYVAVTFTGPTLESERTLSFPSGRLDCPADRVEECRAFLAEVALTGPKSIPLDPAPSEFQTDGTDGSTDGSTGDGTDGSTDGSTQAEG